MEIGFYSNKRKNEKNNCRRYDLNLRPSGHKSYALASTHYEKYYTGSPKSGKDYRLFVEKLDILRRKWEVQGIRWHFLTILQYLQNICKNHDENCVTLYGIPVFCCLCTACELFEYCYKDFTHNYHYQYKISYSSNITEWFSKLCTKDTYSNKQKQNSTLCQQGSNSVVFKKNVVNSPRIINGNQSF